MIMKIIANRNVVFVQSRSTLIVTSNVSTNNPKQTLLSKWQQEHYQKFNRA